MNANRIKHGVVGGLAAGVVLGLVYHRGENCFLLKAGRSGDEDALEKPDLRAIC